MLNCCASTTQDGFRGRNALDRMSELAMLAQDQTKTDVDLRMTKNSKS